MATSLPVLTFHALDDGDRATSLRPAVFERGLRALRDRGYRTLHSTEVAAGLDAAAPWPERAVALCFDDGDRSTYRVAFPLLQELGLRATVFVLGTAARAVASRAHFEGRELLSAAEILELHRGGVQIGAHTVSHADLTRLDDTARRREVLDGKRALEDLLGAPVPCFAYPYGRLDRASRELVGQHFAAAFTDRLGLVSRGADRRALPRVDTYYLRTPRRFEILFTRLFRPYVALRAVPRSLRRLARGDP